MKNTLFKIRYDNVLLLSILLSVLVYSSELNKSFTLPKASLLMLFSFYSIIYFFLFFLPDNKLINLKVWILPLLFILIFFILSITSKNLYLSAFGAYGRFTGFLFWLSLVFLMFMCAITLRNNKNLINMIFIVGCFTAGYGLLQFLNSDLTIKSDSYKIIGTLGNPNYVSTLLGLTSTVIIWKLLTEQEILLKLLLVTFLAMSVFVVIKSESSQGLFLLFICNIFYFLSKIFFVNKKYGFILYALSLIPIVSGILGLLQKGPLSQFLYQYSVSLRGDYWRAAFEMFNVNKFIGIGIERYGVEFQSYRDSTSAFRNPASFTDDPHNEILYFLSSGGIILTLSYILLLLSIFGISIYGLRESNKHNRDQILILLTLWIGLRIESLISVNQITNNVIEWIIAGALISSSVKLKIDQIGPRLKSSDPKYHNVLFKKFILVILVLIFALAIITPKLRADANFANYNRNLGSGLDSQTLMEKRSLILSAIDQSPNEMIYYEAAIRFMVNTNDLQYGKSLIKTLLRIDQHYYSAYELLAIISEREGDFNLAIANRVKAFDLDPYDLSNISSLRDLYIKVGNLSEALRITDYFKNLNLDPNVLKTLE